jgi:hypothetical protein
MFARRVAVRRSPQIIRKHVATLKSDVTAQYREKGRTKKTSRLELAIKRHVAAALNGDVGSAAMLLKMRAQAIRLGDTGSLIIQFVSAVPRCPMKPTNKKSPDQV